MPELPHNKQDFLDGARHQLTQISAEFEKALAAVKDPQRRKQLTASYLDLLQKGLTRAQDSVAKYQGRFAQQPPSAGGDAGSPAAAAPTPPSTTPPTTPPPAPTEPQPPQGSPS